MEKQQKVFEGMSNAESVLTSIQSENANIKQNIQDHMNEIQRISGIELNNLQMQQQVFKNELETKVYNEFHGKIYKEMKKLQFYWKTLYVF